MHSLPQLLISALLILALPTDAPSPQTELLAARIGLTPEALVVAGFSSNEAKAIVDELGTNGDHASTLASAQSLVDTKAAALTVAHAALQGSPGSSELIAGRNVARSELSAAQVALQAAPATVRTALVLAADPGKKALLETYVAGSGHATPPEFKAVSRTDAEWTALEGALRAEARATRRGETLAEGHASLLSTARANEAVSAAKTRLDNNLASVKAVFTPQS